MAENLRNQGQGAIDSAIKSLDFETIQRVAEVADQLLSNGEEGPGQYLQDIGYTWEKLYEEGLPSTGNTERLG